MMRPLRAAARALRIAWVLLRHDVLPMLPEPAQHRGLRLLQRAIRPDRTLKTLPPEVRFRLALESLGPIFVKFGQLLATRRDILPLTLALELTHLQEAVTPFSGAQALIEQSLGSSVDEFFNHFDPNPLASASVAQVHAAELPDGRKVVIKILRPGIEQQVRQDIELMRWLTRTVTQLIPELKRFHLEQVVSQYDEIIHNELDLRLEAANGKRFAQNFANSKTLYVPKVYEAFTRKNLLVLERVFGTPIDNIQALQDKGVDLKVLSRIGVETFFAQVFRDNFFHADMHPGNIHVDTHDPKNPRYISLDCAIVGELDPQDQLLLGRKLLALLRKDFSGVAQLMVQGHWVPALTDTERLASTLEKLLSPLLSQPLATIEFGPLLVNLFAAARKFDLQALPQFMLLEKTLIHVEGLGKQLDPELDIFAIGQPLLEAWVKEKLGPKALIAEFEKAWPRWLEQAAQGPALLTNFIKQHQLQQHIQLQTLYSLKTSHEQSQRARKLWPWQALATGIVLIGLFQVIQSSGVSAAALGTTCIFGGLISLWLANHRPNVSMQKMVITDPD